MLKQWFYINIQTIQATCMWHNKILWRVLTTCSPGKNISVLLPITAWLKRKKAWLFGQGLLNNQTFWGHTRVNSGEYKLINGKLWEGMMMTQKLSMCISACWQLIGVKVALAHLNIVCRKSCLRHLEAKRSPILTGSCVNKSVTVLKPMQQERSWRSQPQKQLK